MENTQPTQIKEDSGGILEGAVLQSQPDFVEQIFSKISEPLDPRIKQDEIQEAIKLLNSYFQGSCISFNSLEIWPKPVNEVFSQRKVSCSPVLYQIEPFGNPTHEFYVPRGFLILFPILIPKGGEGDFAEPSEISGQEFTESQLKAFQWEQGFLGFTWNTSRRDWVISDYSRRFSHRVSVIATYTRDTKIEESMIEQLKRSGIATFKGACCRLINHEFTQTELCRSGGAGFWSICHLFA